MSKIDHTERNRSIYESRKNGETYAKISRDHGVSRERVKQILDSQERRESVRRRRSAFLEENDVMEMPIEIADLSVRSSNSLRNVGLKTVRDMMDIDFDNPCSLRIPNFGKTSAAECKAFVESVRAGGCS